ncbi:MAG: HmuY family protein [Bacteroidales bacterium]|nr:HmuY family protein [Bacteroidales bacterium]
MKKLLTLLIIASIGLVSCDKEETIAPKDYTTYTVDVNMNNALGKLIPKLNPATRQPMLDDEGNVIMENQYFYSEQYLFNLTNEDLVGVVNSDPAYVDFVLPVNPASELVAMTTANGEWQIALTQYTTEIPYEEDGETLYMEYPTVGALINTQANITVAHIEDANFETLTLADAKNATYSSEVDAIGYEWKAISYVTYTYDIVQDNYFLVKISADEIFKLRFLDFYNTDAEKGHIKFQFQLLQ